MNSKRMPLKTIERLLEEKIGLSVDTIGVDTITSVINRRMAECNLRDYAAYVRYLGEHEIEWEDLIEAVVVPETWFFRNEESFVFLGRYIKTEWTAQHPGGTFRALSIPCSSGEEPYSIAMTCMEAGLSTGQFVVDAVDISQKALAKAQKGIYGPESFRRHDTLPLRDQYFVAKDDGSFHIHQQLHSTVRWLHGNLLNEYILQAAPSYNVVFCRNLLIYLSVLARNRVSATINRLLARRGLLFVGHAERPLFQAKKFVAVTMPGVFAYYREGQLDESVICGEQHPAQPFERRRTSRIAAPPQNIPKRQAAAPPPPPPPPPPPAKPEIERHQPPPPSRPDSQPPAVIERRKPHNPTMQQLDRARELADQGNLNEALHLCDAVLAENAAHVQAHFLMGLVYQALKDENRAEKSFNKTIYLDPDHHEALYYLVLMMEERGQPEKAKQLRQRIHRIYQRTRKD